MAAVRVEFALEAAEEAQAARDWYAERSKSAALSFVEELTAAIGRIVESPLRWSKAVAGTRRVHLHRFPFSIFYRLKGTSIQVIAVAHTSRRPGYWRKRSGKS
jgi:plasmid stabilization system protein ParE